MDIKITYNLSFVYKIVTDLKKWWLIDDLDEVKKEGNVTGETLSADLDIDDFEKKTYQYNIGFTRDSKPLDLGIIDINDKMGLGLYHDQNTYPCIFYSTNHMSHYYVPKDKMDKFLNIIKDLIGQEKPCFDNLTLDMLEIPFEVDAKTVYQVYRICYIYYYTHYKHSGLSLKEWTYKTFGYEGKSDFIMNIRDLMWSYIYNENTRYWVFPTIRERTEKYLSQNQLTISDFYKTLDWEYASKIIKEAWDDGPIDLQWN